MLVPGRLSSYFVTIEHQHGRNTLLAAGPGDGRDGRDWQSERPDTNRLPSEHSDSLQLAFVHQLAVKSPSPYRQLQRKQRFPTPRTLLPKTKPGGSSKPSSD